MIVFTDLEETLIKYWSNPVMIPDRLDIVRQHLIKHPHAQLGLMSWAVWHEKDMEAFNHRLRPMLEEALGHHFSPRWALSMDGWAQEMLHHGRKKLDRSEMFDLFGKEDVFLTMARRHPEWAGREVFLFDDAVPASTFSINSGKTLAHMVNVKELAP